MRRIISTLVLLAAASTAQAQSFTANDNPFRVELGYQKTKSKMQATANNTTFDGTAASNGLGTKLSYNFHEKFFAAFTYTKTETEELTLDGQSLLDGSEQADASKAIQLGYRSPRSGKVGEYWGVAYQSDIGDDDDSSGGIFSTFTEKDTLKRFGKIEFEFSNSNGKFSALSGTHVWFLDSGLGVGLKWGIAKLEDENEGIPVEATATRGGLVLMYRPKL